MKDDVTRWALNYIRKRYGRGIMNDYPASWSIPSGVTFDYARGMLQARAVTPSEWREKWLNDYVPLPEPELELRIRPLTAEELGQ